MVSISDIVDIAFVVNAYHHISKDDLIGRIDCYWMQEDESSEGFLAQIRTTCWNNRTLGLCGKN